MAYEHGAILHGDGSWPWTATVDHDDIVVRGGWATWFGGTDDPMDNGETASGISTADHPDIQGCSLPMDIGSKGPATQGSPIPRLPWQTPVRVWCYETSKQITIPAIDRGPAKWTGHALDLTQAAFRALGVPLGRGKVKVDYRIIGGAALARAALASAAAAAAKKAA